MTMLILVYIAQVLIVSFSNEAIAYVPKKDRSKVWLWLNSKMNVSICLLCQLMTWFEERSSSNNRGKRKRSPSRYRRKSTNPLYRSTMAWLVVVLATKTPVKTNSVQFNTDSAHVGIDN